jgi:hypothetical protein
MQILSIFGSTDKSSRRTDAEEEPKTRKLFRTYITLEPVKSAVQLSIIIELPRMIVRQDTRLEFTESYTL